MTNPWKLRQRNLVFQNKFGYRLYEDDVLSPSGAEAKYMVLESLGYVVIVALTKDGKVLMEKQWRYPVGKEFLELPAGTIDLNEDPLMTAQRELQEEAGAISNHWVCLASYWLGNGVMKIKAHVFLAQDIEFVKKSPESNEKITIESMDFDHAIKMITECQIDEERTITGLLLAEKYLTLHSTAPLSPSLPR